MRATTMPAATRPARRPVDWGIRSGLGRRQRSRRRPLFRVLQKMLQELRLLAKGLDRPAEIIEVVFQAGHFASQLLELPRAFGPEAALEQVAEGWSVEDDREDGDEERDQQDEEANH